MAATDKERFADPGNERMVLSCALRNPDLIIDIAAKVTERDFLSPNHKSLYSVLQYLYEQGLKTFDLMAVVNEASNKGVLELIGGADYVDALQSSLVDPSNLDIYVNRVFDCSTKYKLFLETERIRDNILANTGPADKSVTAPELIAAAESRILDVSMVSNQIEDAEDISVGLRELLEEKARNPIEVLGLSTGVPLLDKAINGFTPGSLTVIAARAKGGKSTLMLNMASNVAYILGKPVLFIDTELTRAEFQMRAVSHISAVPERMVTNGTFATNNQMTENIWRATKIVEQGRLYHRYMPGFTMDAVKSMARKYHARNGIAAVFFDYIKMPEVTKAEGMKEHQLLGNIATGLKDLAGVLNVPVIAAAQIKRGDSNAPKSRFHDTDVADSDRIGRYCNNLLTIASKTKKEREEDGPSCGTHRLQVLLSRAGSPNYHGIDLDCNLPTITMRQAKHQSYGAFEQSQERFS